jgi:uncharacterized protein YndB with AHSA1/START domain
MTTTPAPTDLELVLTRDVDAPVEKLFRAWTDPELLKQWFAPKPFTITKIDSDVRPGGKSLVVMQSPDGEEYPNAGLYLEVVPNQKIVFTDAFTEGWVPAKPFMVATVTFEDLGGGKTRYTAKARHWTLEDKQTHEQMGFHEGWGQCLDQLVDLTKTF